MREPNATFKLPTLLHGADYAPEQWLDAPEVLDADLQLMKEVGLNAVSIGMFAWPRLEPAEGDYRFGWLDDVMDRLAENGIHAILGTPSGARPAWMSFKYPQVLQVDATGRRARHQARQNHCRTSPVYREKCVAINRRLAERYGEHPALLMWHVSNEYGAGQCHCEYCYAAFRDWLKARYGDLDALNRAWWTDFWGHRFSAWEQIEPVDISCHGLMLDWQRFISDQTLDFFLTEAAPLRELTPHVPVTTNFMQPDVGLNYWNFAHHVDIVSWDSYPRWHAGDDVATGARTAFYHDLHRSYKRAPFMLMESTPSVTNWQGVSRPKRPGMHVLSSLQAVAHGSDTVQYFQWRQGRGGSEMFHGAVMTHLDRTDTRVFGDVQDVGRWLGELGDVRGTGITADVAVIYDFETEWALNHAQLPQDQAKDYQARCREHHAALRRLDLASDVIDADADFDGYRLVVAPMLYLLRPGVAERVEAFVRGGGVFVTTYLSGLVDRSGLAFRGGFPDPWRRTLGLWVEETDTFYDHQAQLVTPTPAGEFLPPDGVAATHYADVVRLESAEALAEYAREFYQGSPAITRNAHGAGRAYYLATRFGAGMLDVFYAELQREHGLGAGSAIARADLRLPEGVSVTVRGADERALVFVMNFTDEVQHVDLTSLEASGWVAAAAPGEPAVTAAAIAATNPAAMVGANAAVNLATTAGANAASNSAANLPPYGLKVLRRVPVAAQAAAEAPGSTRVDNSTERS